MSDNLVTPSTHTGRYIPWVLGALLITIIIVTLYGVMRYQATALRENLMALQREMQAVKQNLSNTLIKEQAASEQLQREFNPSTAGLQDTLTGLYDQLALLDQQIAALPLKKDMPQHTLNFPLKDTLAEGMKKILHLIIIRHTTNNALPSIPSENNASALHALIAQAQAALLHDQQALYYHNLTKLQERVIALCDNRHPNTLAFLALLKILLATHLKEDAAPDTLNTAEPAALQNKVSKTIKPASPPATKTTPPLLEKAIAL